MNIHATSRNDSDTIRDLNRAKFGIRHYHTVFVAAAVLIVLLAIFQIITGGFGWLTWIYAVLLLGWLGFYGYEYFVAPGRLYRKDKRAKDADNIFDFGDDGVTVVCNAEAAYAKYSVGYDAIYAVYEEKERFYLFLSPDQAFAVDKDSVSGGSMVELRGELFGKLGEKRYQLRTNGGKED